MAKYKRNKKIMTKSRNSGYFYGPESKRRRKPKSERRSRRGGLNGSRAATQQSRLEKRLS